MKPGDFLENHFRLTPPQKTALKKLGVLRVHDLLRHFPTRYGDTAEVRNIGSLEKGQTATIFGKISKLKTGKAFIKKIPMATAEVEDETGKIKIVWFNQPYLAKMIPEEALVRIDGKVSERRPKKSKDHALLNGEKEVAGELYFSNPKVERVTKIPLGVGESLFGETGKDHHLYPVYPESRGISSNWLYHEIQKVMKTGVLETLRDPIPDEILRRYNLPSLHTALIWIHAPKSQNDALAARKRFAFGEVFFIQLERQLARREYESSDTFKIPASPDTLKKFISRFPFKPTGAQIRSVETIISDFQKDRPMMRLLEGDVGSGKTFVAAATAYATITTRPLKRAADGSSGTEQNFGTLQAAVMAPTEILAKQHFQSFMEYFSHLPIQIGLITSSGCLKFPSKVNPKGATNISRSQFLKWVANGEIAIVVGTHALIQKSVAFKHLAFAVVDEQHRFGTKQRAKLISKSGIAPHLLSMTATPIPRTLALTVFGDLDLSLLDELPPGRKPIITEIVTAARRNEIYEKIRRELAAGRQCYIICPRIDEPDPDKELALQAKSVKEEARRLKEKVFQEFEIGVVHGKLNPPERDKVMNAFSAGKIQILCATSVVEVGVNVPNATVIVIEGAERFGLAQLHQLRGRVQRSSYQSYCYVFTESGGGLTGKRLKAFEGSQNGFELAEKDLQLRGAGDLAGLKQWGISDIAMEALKNLKMVEAARTEAIRIISEDPELSHYPLLKTQLSDPAEKIHFE